MTTGYDYEDLVGLAKEEGRTARFGIEPDANGEYDMEEIERWLAFHEDGKKNQE